MLPLQPIPVYRNPLFPSVLTTILAVSSLIFSDAPRDYLSERNVWVSLSLANQASTLLYLILRKFILQEVPKNYELVEFGMSLLWLVHSGVFVSNFTLQLVLGSYVQDLPAVYQVRFYAILIGTFLANVAYVWDSADYDNAVEGYCNAIKGDGEVKEVQKDIESQNKDIDVVAEHQAPPPLDQSNNSRCE